MRHDQQVTLIKRYFELREARSTDLAPAIRMSPTADYTSDEVYERERVSLFRALPNFVTFSADLPSPGHFCSITVDGLPIVVVRGEDGLLRGLINACRHRGAPIFQEVRGVLQKRAILCPFHAWTYDINGELLGQPLARNGFDQCDPATTGLRKVRVEEHLGMVFAYPNTVDGGEPRASVDDIIGGATDELTAFNLGDYRHVESRSRTWPMNWKLALNTFLETYHFFSLHRNTIGPWFASTPTVFDDFGLAGRMIGFRSSITELRELPESEWSILPYATIVYVLAPNVLIMHQVDHLEVWRMVPLSAREADLVVSLYIDDTSEHDVDDPYWGKNLDFLLSVTDVEDFTQAAATYRGLLGGSLDHMILGRNEPALVHFHETLEHLLATEAAA